MVVHVGDDDYEVGYGKPPEHAKFKKGKSGNPRGRPKVSRLRSVATLWFPPPMPPANPFISRYNFVPARA
jgi:hypothetical protein